MVWNIPNTLTLSRLVLAVVFFVLVHLQLWWPGVAVFLAAVLTDMLDGHLARRWKQTTSLGRVMDPFVDKIIILGAFIFLLLDPSTGVQPWMVIVMLVRELLVTAIRGWSESQGRALGAKWAGKSKMVLQSVTIVVVLTRLAWYGPHAPDWSEVVCQVLLYLTVAVTVVSGWPYVRELSALGGGDTRA